jgi:hypothetical protein
MSKIPTRTSAARRNAEAMLNQSRKRESSFMQEQAREHDAMVEKTARLRALRLAKEAEDREAAALAPAPAPRSKSAARKK